MGVSLADIDRSNPGVVLDVFNAAQKQATAVRGANDNLAKLPAFSTWSGDVARAVQDAFEKVRIRAITNDHSQSS